MSGVPYGRTEIPSGYRNRPVAGENDGCGFGQGVARADGERGVVGEKGAAVGQGCGRPVGAAGCDDAGGEAAGGGLSDLAGGAGFGDAGGRLHQSAKPSAAGDGFAAGAECGNGGDVPYRAADALFVGRYGAGVPAFRAERAAFEAVAGAGGACDGDDGQGGGFVGRVGGGGAGGDGAVRAGAGLWCAARRRVQFDGGKHAGGDGRDGARAGCVARRAAGDGGGRQADGGGGDAGAAAGFRFGGLGLCQDAGDGGTGVPVVQRQSDEVCR